MRAISSSCCAYGFSRFRWRYWQWYCFSVLVSVRLPNEQVLEPGIGTISGQYGRGGGSAQHYPELVGCACDHCVWGGAVFVSRDTASSFAYLAALQAASA